MLWPNGAMLSMMAARRGCGATTFGTDADLGTSRWHLTYLYAETATKDRPSPLGIDGNVWSSYRSSHSAPGREAAVQRDGKETIFKASKQTLVLSHKPYSQWMIIPWT